MIFPLVDSEKREALKYELIIIINNYKSTLKKKINMTSVITNWFQTKSNWKNIFMISMFNVTNLSAILYRTVMISIARTAVTKVT